MKWQLGAVMCMVCMSTRALDAAPAQHERIAAERAAAIARFNEQARACQAHFVVTACVEAAQREQRATLTRLHRQELQLDEAQRREAAAAQLGAIRGRIAAQAARDRDAASAAAAGTAPAEHPTSPAPAPRAAATGLTRTGAHGASAQDRRAVEQRNRVEFEARVRAAQAHREAVERRNAQRAAEGKVAPPLQMPSGAPAP
ncbi:MAG: hypothetical protein KGI87_10690 [Burkholderiales bacterium]|nr:hypothetical protein [Burkholderiales bacterium]